MNFLFPGRFQPFHYEHKKIVDYVKEHYKQDVIIGVLKPNKLNFYNPFTSEEVKEIIQSYFKEKLEFVEFDGLFDFCKFVKINKCYVIVGKSLKNFLYRIASIDTIEVPSDRIISSTNIKKR